jgi:hypothetical protein
MRPGAAAHIIADSDGRWARAHGLSLSDGHNAGADTLRGTRRADGGQPAASIAEHNRIYYLAERFHK